MDRARRRKIFDAMTVPVLSIISGLLVAAILVLFTGESPWEAYKTLFSASFGCAELSRCALFSMLERATPLILTGLSAVVAFRSGMFSLGQEGQMMIGSIMAAWLGYVVMLPAGIHPVFVMLVAMAAGGAYGWIPGWLKVRLGVNEIISTIVMNSIAILFLEYVVNFPLRADAGATAHSHIIHETAWLPTFFPGSRWGFGFIIALAAAAAVYYFLWHSSSGYQQRMAGQAPLFARFGGIYNERIAIRSMFISGALAGLAGAIEVLGVHHRIITGFSVNLGFDGLSVAILGQVHPIGVVIVGMLIAGVRLGAQLGLQIQMGIPRELGGTVIALIILFVAAEKFFQNNIDTFRQFWERIRPKEPVGELGED
ncbi:MAG: ABC transporter permease [Chloroflexi bacterium]|nr:MAG: ABC transporter permease [Chloroflexota bacterium]MBL1194710.1 ABC transporter permease [Chloroflexota bacterium]NOH12003.1 ABC transporter permease [Chloroflexota bacterium]